MSLIRLHKFLSSAGFCSRRKGEELIASCRVKVNGITAKEPGTKVDPLADQVEVDGKIVLFGQPLVYIALNKPRGYVTTCLQSEDKTVMELMDLPLRIYPVGRLDKDSTGLLILTNDGRLHHFLSHPSFDHEKEYDVTVEKPIPDGALKHMEKGMPILGSKTRPAEITRISGRRFRIILKEGKNRQIRRMVEKTGNKVTKLKRIRISSLNLGRLKEGSWRYLTEKERLSLLEAIENNYSES
jgi:23S rRNA pseudouridine2605 synthase/23S rRNA pseudouridine2604 synthase